MDLLLGPYLLAQDEASREAHLQELILVHAGPVIRHILRQKLDFFIGTAGAQPHPPEAADLWQNILAKLLHILADERLKTGAKEINNFGGLVTRIAVNGCHDYLRAQAPMRARASNSLREVVNRHPSFAAWKRGKATIYGFRQWQGNPPSSETTARIAEFERLSLFERLRVLGLSELSQTPGPGLLAAIFQWLDGPLESERLSLLWTSLLDIREPVQVALVQDDEWPYAPVSNSPPGEEKREAEELLRKCWFVIKDLPGPQRVAFSLGFADENGEDLFSWLTGAGVAGWEELAEMLGYPVSELVAWWGRMPMDNGSIAEILGATRAQVSKWKFRAYEQLAKALSERGLGK